MSPPAAAAKAMFSDDESGSGSGSDSDSGSEDSGSSSGSDETAKRVSSKAGNVVGKETDVLTINKKFAERFEHNKRREETHRLQEKVKREYILRPGDVGEGSDSETSSSESDEGDVPAKFDAQFAEALLKIKTKDPAIYREDAELFSSDDGDDDDDAKVKKKRAPKKQTLREVTARQLLEGGAEAYEQEDAEAEARRREASGRSYVEEQEDLKNAFKTAAGIDVKKTSEKNASDSDSDSGGLRVKRRAISGFSDSEEDAEDDDDEDDDEKRVSNLARTKLGAFFRADGAKGEADKNEAFLRDYLLNEKWRDAEDGGEDGKSGFTYQQNRKRTKRSRSNDGSDVESEEVSDSEEDARAFEEAERFEQKYNFRFEEPDGGVIQSHARTIEGTVRKEKTSRRDARLARNERKLSEKERLRAEVRRLKNLKREEIRAKMSQIAAVGGLAGAEAVAAADLNAEFDPEQHDRAMAAMYGEQYYGGALLDEEGEELEKPEFGDLDEEVNAVIGAVTEEEGGAADDSEKFKRLREAMLARSTNGTFEGDRGDDIDDDDDDEDDDDDGGMVDAGVEDEDDDAAAANGAADAANGSDGNKFSKRAAKRWKKELLAKMDEYYALDAEDFIDDVPCRFKYKEVAPSMYGLSTKEMLSMSDKQLTQIVPLKKLAPYRHDADAGTAPKEKMRSQRMAREFLAEAAKRGGEQAGRARGGKKMLARERKGKKDLDKELAADTADPAAAAAAAAADRKASYGARAWGKYNIDKKGKKKDAEKTEKTEGLDTKREAERPSAPEPAATIKPGTGKNAKKNLKKRQKRNELEKAKAAGML